MYLVTQSKDLGKETDAAEDILLETEWWVLLRVTGETLILISFQVGYPRERVNGCDEKTCRVTPVTGVD